MDGAELFSKCLAQATAVVKQVRPEHMANATPDSEWNVRDLTGHMLYELSWVPELVRGQTIDEVGDKYEGDLIDDGTHDLSVKWEQAAAKADLAAGEADLEETAHVSYGDLAVEDYLRQVGGDLLIHAWDLSQGTGMPITFAPDVAWTIYAQTLPRKDSLASSGLFAPAIDVPESADLQTKLLALFGRRANWRAL